MNRRGIGALEWVVIALLVIIALIIILVSFVVPASNFFPALQKMATDVLKSIGISVDNGNEFIRKTELHRGLENTIVFSTIFINDQRIAYYEIRYSNPETPTQETVLKPKFAVSQEFREQGHEFTDTLSLGDGYGPKIIRLYVFDEDGKQLDKRTLDYKGLFPSAYKSFEKDILRFVGFNDVLRGMPNTAGASVGYSLNTQKDSLVAGFSAKYTGGNILVQNKILWIIPWGSKTINRPAICSKSKACLCQCSMGSLCQNEYEALCYSYDGFDSIVGVKQDRNLGEAIEADKVHSYLALRDETGNMYVTAAVSTVAGGPSGQSSGLIIRTS